MTNTARKMMDQIRRFWRYMSAGPESDWERAYLCSMAPLSAHALRDTEEAGRPHS